MEVSVRNFDSLSAYSKFWIESFFLLSLLVRNKTPFIDKEPEFPV
jgi:hypothetical protein